MDEITVKEAAAKLGISRARVDQLIQAGRLPSRLIGPIRVIPASAVQEFSRQPPGRPRKPIV